MLGRAVDQSLARQGDNLGCDSWEVVDRQDAFDLRKQTLDHTKVATSYASDRIDHGRPGVLVERRIQTELHPLVLDHLAVRARSKVGTGGPSRPSSTAARSGPVVSVDPVCQ